METDSAAVIRRWSRHPRTVGLARAQLREALAGWGLIEIEDAALVAVSELVTNAVQHARVSSGREIETRYLREGDGVRIEVHDAADMWPEKQAPDADAEHGRGLALVAALANRWGVSERVGVGKSVWAVLTTSSGDGDWDGS
ncbi:ATP-binding protein [Streptomyces sp. 8N616]|uniref:ATP-binding protein n=1 Tax=Streptomyces sp. 8N616 TaxID=3457414 RepID=UPI003FD5BCC3